MRFLLSVFIIAVLSFIAGIYFPWWGIAIVAFIVSLLIHQKPLPAFLSGFASVFLLWMILASLINAANAGILAARVGQLFGMGSNPTVLIFVTAITGGIVAGFASLTASYVRKR